MFDYTGQYLMGKIAEQLDSYWHDGRTQNPPGQPVSVRLRPFGTINNNKGLLLQRIPIFVSA